MKNKNFIKKDVNINSLFIDPNNYRFINHKDYVHVKIENIKNSRIQNRTRNFILGHNQKNIKDLEDSFKANGYLEVDQIQVVELSENEYKVIEGNRRVVTLKKFKDDYDKNLNIGNLDEQIFKKVPVVIYPESKNGRSEIVMGLKHISGTKKWGILNQAQLLDDLISKYKWKAEKIYNSLGISKQKFNKYRRALHLVNDFKKSDYGDKFEKDMFATFVDIISNLKMKNWLNWNDTNYKAENENNKTRLYSWLVEIEETETEDKRTDYENNEEEAEDKILPKIVNKSKDIWIISKFLDDEKALKTMEDKRDINEAYSSSEQVGIDKFKNSLETIKKQITEAKSFKNYSEETDKKSIKHLIEELKELDSNVAYGGIILDKRMEKNIYISFKSKVFSEINLINFKQFKDFKIRNINQINIFAGINNSGKSSILEAIFLLSKLNDLNSFFDIQVKRAKFNNKLANYWLKDEFYKYNLSAIFDNKKLNYSARLFETDEDIDKVHYSYSIEINSEFSSEKLKSIADIYINNKIDKKSKKINWLCNSSFNNPFYFQNKEDIIFAHDKSVELKTYDKIIFFLQKYVDKGIKKIIYVGDTNRFLVYHKSFDKAMDLRQFGEGVQRIFFISLQMAVSKNGIMCIDEIENAIHHSLFENFIKFLVELSMEFNIQLFISSHSLEFINSFFQEEKNIDKISVYRINKKENKCSIDHAYGEEYNMLKNNLNLDLRG